MSYDFAKKYNKKKNNMWRKEEIGMKLNAVMIIKLVEHYRNLL